MSKVYWGRLLGGLCALCAVTLAQALLPANEQTLLLGAVFDAGHVPLFAVVALVALWILQTSIRREGPARLQNYLLALGLVVLLGLGTEFLQIFAARDAGLGDFGRDLIGGGAALVAALAFDRRTWAAPAFVRVLLTLGAAVVAVSGMAPSLFVYRDYGLRDAAFPSICGFDDPWEMRFVHGNNAVLSRVDPPAGWDEARGKVGRLDLGNAPYPGLGMREPYPDWTGYEALEFSVWAEQPHELVLRVHDFAHDQSYTDRFNRTLVLQPGANRFHIALEDIAEGPRDRRLDLQEIAGLAVFADRPAEPFTVWLDDFRLVSGRSAP